MTGPSDNVYKFPGLAARAVKAMTDYKVAINKEAADRTQAISAVIEYGNVLLEGRNQDRSNISFKMWVTDNKLDVGKPWDDNKERSNAMKLAVVLGSYLTRTPAYLEASPAVRTRLQPTS